MSAFYDASRALFAALTSAAPKVAMDVVDDGKIASLRALVAQLDEKQQALEKAVTDLQNSGETNDDLSHALLVATFDFTATQQLLLLAIDGKEEIVADAKALDDLTEKLEAIGTSTKELTDTIGKVASVLDLVGKVTKLATA